MILKLFQIVIALTCFNSIGQTEIILSEHGDSSTILIGINDTFAYISFTDPDNINNGNNWYVNSNTSGYNFNQDKPNRSSLLVEYHFEKDKLVLTEIFGKRYINPSIEYSSFEMLQKDRLDVLFEGKVSIGDSYLNTFDSLFIEINDNLYLGDLNTSIFHFRAKKPKSKKFTVRIYDAQKRVDYAIPVKLNKNINGLFIKFELIESQLHSLMAQEHIKQRIPSDIMIEGKNYQLTFEFIDWMHYWETNEIIYY